MIAPPRPELWRTYSSALRERLGLAPGTKVFKVSVDAGFTCPNIDGRKGVGGCTYCNNASFSPAARLAPRPSVAEQVRVGKEALARRYGAEKVLAYFQAYSSTDAPVARLRALYDEALAAHPDVIGLDVGTRPDCVPDEVLDLLRSYARERGVFVALELGLETASDETHRRTNRGHSVADFVDAVARARARAPELWLSAHAIFGLPGEGREEALATARLLGSLPLDSVKLHHFYLCEGTELAVDWRRGRLGPRLPFETAEEYARVAADALELRPRRIAIERVAADCFPPLLIAPAFTGREATEATRRVLEGRGGFQGRRAEG